MNEELKQEIFDAYGKYPTKGINGCETFIEDYIYKGQSYGWTIEEHVYAKKYIEHTRMDTNIGALCGHNQYVKINNYMKEKERKRIRLESKRLWEETNKQ